MEQMVRTYLQTECLTIVFPSQEEMWEFILNPSLAVRAAGEKKQLREQSLFTHWGTHDTLISPFCMQPTSAAFFNFFH